MPKLLGLGIWVLVVLPLLYRPAPSLAESAGQPQTQPAAPQQQAEGEPRGTASAPFFVQVIPSPKTAEERAQEAKDRHEKATVDWWLMAFTGVVAFATLGLIAATGVLGYFAFQQMRDTRILQRANLAVEPGGVHSFKDGTDRLSCEIVIRNAGNLVASEVSWFIDRVISDEDGRTNFAIGQTGGHLILAPKIEAIKGSRFLDRDNILTHRPSGPRGRATWLYVWGRVDYHDGFRGGRFIEFCHRYHLAVANPGSGEIDAKAGRYHRDGNHTDEG